MIKKSRQTLLAVLCLVILFSIIGTGSAIFGDDAKYIGSVNSEVYHYLNCSSAAKILDKNKVYFLSATEAIADGRHP